MKRNTDSINDTIRFYLPSAEASSPRPAADARAASARFRGAGFVKPRFFRGRREGFTLIELLAVIAVVAILAALLIVAIGSVREAALDAKSASNLRQIGAALNLYVNDNKGEIMPRAANADEVDEGESRFWTGALYGGGYLEDKEAFYDPSFPPFGPENSERAENFETDIQQTFGMRGWIKPGTDQPQYSRRQPKRVSVIDNPGEFFIVADSIWLNWMAQGYGISPNHSNQKVRLNDEGTATALFMDGHVEEKPADYFLELGETQGKYSDDEGYDVWHPGDGDS